jgi:hypothetical protein
MIKHSVISILIIVVVFIILISSTYGFVIPTFWADYKTPTILIVGVAIAAIFGGYICYQIPYDDTLFVKISYGLFGAAVVAVLVFFISLAVIIKIRGS